MREGEECCEDGRQSPLVERREEEEGPTPVVVPRGEERLGIVSERS